MPKCAKQPLNWTVADHVRNQTSASDFKIGVKLQADAVELLVHGVIGDSWDALDSASIVTLLKDNPGKTINVNINSPGGLAFDGVSIYNALVNHDGPVNVDITGIAASAATIIAMAGDNIRIAENGTFMIHRAWGVSIGNHKVMLDVAEMLEKLDGQIAATYAARTGRKAETMLRMMDGTVDGTTFTGTEAVAEGFVDEVIPLKKKSKDSDANNKTVSTTAVASATDLLTPVFSAEASNKYGQAVNAMLAKIRLDDDDLSQSTGVNHA